MGKLVARKSSSCEPVPPGEARVLFSEKPKRSFGTGRRTGGPNQYKNPGVVTLLYFIYSIYIC